MRLNTDILPERYPVLSAISFFRRSAVSVSCITFFASTIAPRAPVPLVCSPTPGSKSVKDEETSMLVGLDSIYVVPPPSFHLADLNTCLISSVGGAAATFSCCFVSLFHTT